MTTAATKGTAVTSHAVMSAAAFTVASVAGARGSCSCTLDAPVCFSPPTRRSPRNGKRNVVARYSAPKVGTQIPSRGERLAPSSGDRAALRLASPYRSTAWRKL
jgi:hypothetical protein